LKNAMKRLHLPVLTLVLLLLGAAWTLDAGAQETLSTAELEALIESLEDEQARGELISKLRMLMEVHEPAPVPDIRTATGQLMQSISEGLAVFGTGLNQIARSLEQLPEAYQWLSHVATDPEERAHWLNILLWLAAVLIAAYVVARVVTRLLTAPAPDSPTPRAMGGRNGCLARSPCSFSTSCRSSPSPPPVTPYWRWRPLRKRPAWSLSPGSMPPSSCAW